MARKKPDETPEVIGLVGVGLDNRDGHKRLTHGDEFMLVGGSEETHERMQDVVIRLTESLKERGKRLRDAEPGEVADLLRDAADKG
ncbi:MAG: hypothetical protein L0Y71_00050 [Gemmataceae bacterium]|nr:hypothetical protein [Gemmataceae bacterium]